MVTTALDIITGAAKLIGVVFKSEALDSDEASDGLVTFNEMLDSWSNDLTTIYADTLESFPITGASSYTIGTGANFNTTRPTNIISAVVRIASVDYPLEIINQQQYQEQIAVKSTTTSVPEYLTYDNGYPLGVIKMYAIPTSGSTLFLQTNKPITNFLALTTSVDLPPGWKKALKYNLAIDMAPMYGAEVGASVVDGAKKSLGAIRKATAMNNSMPYMPSPAQQYSIYTGTE